MFDKSGEFRSEETCFCRSRSDRDTTIYSTIQHPVPYLLHAVGVVATYIFSAVAPCKSGVSEIDVPVYRDASINFLVVDTDSTYVPVCYDTRMIPCTYQPVQHVSNELRMTMPIPKVVLFFCAAKVPKKGV